METCLLQPFMCYFHINIIIGLGSLSATLNVPGTAGKDLCKFSLIKFHLVGAFMKTQSMHSSVSVMVTGDFVLSEWDGID